MNKPKYITKEIINKHFPMATPDAETIKELNELKTKYNNNFNKMLTSSHPKYRIIEDQLNKLDIKIRKKLGIYIYE